MSCLTGRFESKASSNMFNNIPDIPGTILWLALLHDDRWTLKA